MKKHTIFLLIAAMVLVLFGLIFAQHRYFLSYIKVADVQFSESVELSLNQAVRYIGEREALTYLSETMVKDGMISEQENNIVSVDSMFCLNNDMRVSISSKHGSASLGKTLNLLRSTFQQNFERSKTLLDQTVFHWLREIEDKEITERINFVELGEILLAIFEENDITQNFYYAIVDKEGNQLYRSHSYEEMQSHNINFKQNLFPHESSGRPVFLQVYFPERGGYVEQAVVLFYPSIMLSLLVLLIFIYTVMVIFRQKRIDTMKTDFVNNMTHEFKTPISSISLASQMLQDETVGKTPIMLKQISNVIQDETKRLSFQVEKVLQMAMFERDKSILKLTEMNLNDLIEDITTTFSLKVEKKGGAISTTLNAENDMALIDEVHFTNVIYNLMDNALKYSIKPLLLNVSTENDKDGNAVIHIEDNGIGINKEDQKRIFEKFFRVSTGNLHNVKGFGMGLAYVKKMIIEHKGIIKVTSEPNIGTKFTITIPTLKNE